MRRALGLLVLIGTLLYLRRRRRGREHVHLHFDDGSTVTLADDALGARGCSRSPVRGCRWTSSA